MVHALRVFRVLAALCLLGAFSEIASAEGVCAAELCERDCKNTVPSILGRHDPRQYEACLAAERACREGIPAIEAACQVSQNYQAGLLLGKEAVRRGVLKSMDQCRQQTNWVTNIVRQTGGEAVGKVSGTCSCFFCEEIIDTAAADGSLEEASTPTPPGPIPQRGRGRKETCEDWIAEIRKIDSTPPAQRQNFCSQLGRGLRAT
ncbi:hypothetical protein LJR290_007930 [Variovorax sp. LjRoot290]|uniref:hypothetical protein n=1 Tax=Variovorax sp. LjRoot290 TaxID=3342316 RepID=UPI003ECC5097